MLEDSEVQFTACMCGILGKLTFRGEHESSDVLDAALCLIDHRGPDDRGTYHSTTRNGVAVFLGQTRLSVLDLSEAGHQPMLSHRSGSVIVYNGEVYNFREIRAHLETAGHHFVSECDTEVILAAYDEWGDRFVERFRGMFAIAVYDPHRNRMILARDRLGIKPLYFYWDGRQFAFGSEVTAMAAIPSLELEVCQTALRNYLRQGFIPGPLSIFQKTRKLPQGCILTFCLDDPKPVEKRYWDPLDFYAQPRSFRDENEVVEAIRSELIEAVRLRLISDVPLGAFLSGGIDSSLVVALMRQVHTGPLKTFTIGFSEPRWNEAPAARRIADHLETEHHEEYLSEANVLDAVREVAQYYDEPFADPSNIPTLMLSRMTRRNVTVALSGDGGDELFWGYDHYNTRAMRWFQGLSSIPRPLRRGMASLCKRVGAEGLRIGHLIEFEDLPMYYMRPRIWQPGLYDRLHRHDVPQDRMLEIGRSVCSRLAGRDRILLTGAMDLQCYLVDDILTKVDRASMAVALEVRVPILDHRVVELAASIPTRFKTAHGEQKRLLRALLGRFLPRALWDRPKKGFGVPLSVWFRSVLRDWAEDELFTSASSLDNWLDRSELRQVMDDHLTGRGDRSGLIWACLQLAAWDRRIRTIRSTGATASAVIR